MTLFLKMIKISKLYLLIIFLIILNSCGGLDDAGKVLRNEKIRTNDEFLIKKREPLSLPPEYKKLPQPNTIKISKEKTDNNINKILKIPKEETSPNSGKLSVEQSIIEKIRK